MNERVMQFRIGMFVIVAGLVLTMLIVWFGESPSLFRDHAYVKIRYDEAPGVAEGITVRKSGIRIGEVLSVDFDERPNQPDGVIVVLSLESKYKIRKGSVAKVSRALIGDVAIDMLPGTGKEFLTLGDTVASAPEIVGEVTPDPSKALAAATAAFEKVGGTLSAIEEAANGFSKVAKKAEKLDDFLSTIGDTGRNISSAAKKIDQVIAENEADLRPAIANIRQASDKLNSAFDPQTAANIRSAADRIATLTAKLDAGMTDLRPVLTDLGGLAKDVKPTTNLGQAVARINRIAADVGLVTSGLRDDKGHLTNGTLQKLITDSVLADNLTRMVGSVNDVFILAKPVVRNLGLFTDKLAKDPAVLGRGVLQGK